MTPPRPLRPVHSIIDPSELAATIEEQYGLRVHSAVLLRSLVNELYRIDTSERQYAAKLYRADDEDDSRARLLWETALIDHLRTDDSLGVPAIVPTLAGDRLTTIAAPEGPRPLIISEWVEGHKPDAPYSDELYAEFGRLIATFHQRTDSFPDTPDAPVHDLKRCLDEPLAAIEPVLCHQPESWRLINRIGTAAHQRLTADPPLDLGIAHGDVSLDNILITETGMAIHDFDLTGIRWRVADLTGVGMTEHFEAFVRGYRSVRHLGEHDLAALPWLQVAGLISNLEFHLVRKPLVRGLDSIQEGWADREIEGLLGLAAELLDR